MRELVFDIEANGLKPTHVWCVCTHDIVSKESKSFVFNDIQNKNTTLIQELKEYFEAADKVIGHNIIDYDLPVLSRLLGISVDRSKVVDTVVLSRLFRPTREGGHSLSEWGVRLNCSKVEHEEWDQYSDAMLHRCEQDVVLNTKVYEHLMREGYRFSQFSIKLEHTVSFILQEMSERGFYLDRNKAEKLFIDVNNRLLTLEKGIQKTFRPTIRKIREYKETLNKDGSLVLRLQKALTKYELHEIDGKKWLCLTEPFNIGSPQQIVDRMNEMGWKPTVFSEKGTPRVCEENFKTLPSDAPPEAFMIRDYLMLRSRKATLEQWLSLVDTDSRVHGKVLSVGAITNRMAHINPNMANIPAVLTKKIDGKKTILKGFEGAYGFDCRDCWGVQDTVNRRLIGVDAKGIQLRVLAHYMNDPEYTAIVIDDKQDIHLRNMEAAGLETRDQAKTFIYAWLLGAGDAKVGQIAGKDAQTGKRIKAKFLNSLPALKRLKAEANEKGTQGFMYGVDGRILFIKTPHHALSAYLQGCEQSVIKLALCLWTKKVKELGIDAFPVAIVHDEYQIDCEASRAEEVAQIVIQSIRDAGQLLKLNCPMDGDARIGLTWGETH